MKIRNISPVGALDVPLIGRVVDAGEVFEVPDADAKVLLKQAANYEAVPATKEKTK